jgi:hypothetical protein
VNHNFDLIRRLSLIASLMFLFAFQQNSQAQDVYNFYFQKQTPANAVLKPEEKTTPKPGETAAPKLDDPTPIWWTPG